MFAVLFSLSVLLAADAPRDRFMERGDIEWHGDFGILRGDPRVWVYGGDGGPGMKRDWGVYSHDLGKATAPPNGPILCGCREGISRWQPPNATCGCWLNFNKTRGHLLRCRVGRWRRK